MKTIFTSKRLVLRAPTTKAEWLSLFFSGCGIYQLIAGHFSEAMDCFQVSLLFDILGRLPEREA